MRQYLRKGILALASLALVGCTQAEESADDQAVSNLGGDPISLDQASMKSLQDEQMQYYTVYEKIMQSLESLKGLDVQTEESFKWAEGEMTRTGSGQEAYEEGELTQFYTQNQASMEGWTKAQTYAFDGSKYYYQADGEDWVEGEEARQLPINYITLTRLLVEDEAAWQVSEDESHYIVEKDLVNSQLLASLGYLFEMPVLLSPHAEITASIRYQVNEETGLIDQAEVQAQVKDLGETYEYQLTSSQTESEGDVPDVDTSAGAEAVSEAKPDEDIFLVAFQKAALQHMPMYELYETQQGGAEAEPQTRIMVYNYLPNFTNAVLEGKVSGENEWQNTGLIMRNVKVAEAQDAPEAVEAMPRDYYSFFYERFTQEFKEFEWIKSEEENDSGQYVLRESVGEKLADLEAIAGGLDLSHLKRDEEAVYAIDYIINQQTLALEGVYLWSLTAKDESIDYVTTLQFRPLSQSVLESFAHSVPDTFWKQIDAQVNES
ncbi:hypothetical protein [Suicoccus acidiformans]|uniref:hypothetical protein n=1 Tax=Suicoccus acidiformans TaxID=2036206 RepID=UPI0013C2A4A0|nr:hypothetical protein [Suicoccus acidiformans]